jgi:hypothetical protein
VGFRFVRLTSFLQELEADSSELLPLDTREVGTIEDDGQLTLQVMRVQCQAPICWC